MTDFVPDLDTIAFDALVERARADIPRYAPDWTDHNLHDPGMTLIDLLAWIVDQQVYRTGFVGGRHREAFAALLGRHPTPPAPARGLLWPDHSVPGGRVLAPHPTVICLTHRDMAFDVDLDAVYLPPAALTSVVGADGTEATFDGGTWSAGTGFTLGFDGPLAGPGPAPVVVGFDIVAPPTVAVTAADQAWGPVRYTYRTGGSGWYEASVVRDDTFGLAATGVVVLQIPAGPAGPSELQVSLRRGFFPQPPQIRAVAINVLPIVQLSREAADAFSQRGTGEPDQVIDLDTTDLIAPPEIQVGDDPWQQKTDLHPSGPSDHHFLVRPDGVQFGNGVNGQRPPAGAIIRHGELKRTAGTGGNLRTALQWSVPAVDPGVYGRNRQALSGGQDAGGDLAAAARDVAVQRSVLLTDDDLVAAAKALPGLLIQRAEAIAGFDRRLPDRRVAGVRTLVVVPPQPAAGHYVDVVAARLTPRRVLGERLVIEEPVVVAVELALSLTIDPSALDAEPAVRQRLQDRLSISAWPLGRPLAAAEVMTIAAEVPGVTDVPLVRMAVSGQPLGDGPITPPRDGVLVAAEIRFEAGG